MEVVEWWQQQDSSNWPLNSKRPKRGLTMVESWGGGQSDALSPRLALDERLRLPCWFHEHGEARNYLPRGAQGLFLYGPLDR